ncbi:hypothetical protein D3C72_2132980 [compost metagenome]
MPNPELAQVAEDQTTMHDQLAACERIAHQRTVLRQHVDQARRSRAAQAVDSQADVAQIFGRTYRLAYTHPCQCFAVCLAIHNA